MNRKQLLKNLKNEKKARRNIEDSENYVTRFIGTIFGVLVFLVIGYLLIGIFVTKTIKFGKKDEEKTAVTIDSSIILLSNILKQVEAEYMVVIYDINDTDNKTISNYINLYKGKHTASTIYSVDSKNKMNAKYIVEKDSNKEAKSIEELKVVSPTLIKVVDGKITEYHEGKDEVKSILKE